MYNRLRRKKQILKITPVDEDQYPDELINKKVNVDITPVLFQINVDLDSFLYTIPKNRYDFLRTEAEMVLGKGYKDWTPEERKNFLWNIRYEATLIDSRSPDPHQWDCFPEEAMTELEKSYARKKRLKRSNLEDLERMKRKNDQRK
jgi:hypothetical protein